MLNIIIDEEFKYLLPALDTETYARLEEDLIENGCRDAIILWGNIIIDGHNRFEICTRLEIPFETVEMEFESREEVLIWIINTQLSRRNLTPIQLTYFRGVHYRTDKLIPGTGRQSTHNIEECQNGILNKSTKSRLSDQYGVAPRTIARDARVAEGIDAIGATSPEAKRMILAGEIRIARNHLEEIPNLLSETVSRIAISIEEGTYERPQSGNGLQSNDSLQSSDKVQSGIFTPPNTTLSLSDRLPLLTHSLSAISEITDSFYSELRRRASSDDIIGSKSALRLYIDTLEKLYDQM
jgi:hypothetical protein